VCERERALHRVYKADILALAVRVEEGGRERERKRTRARERERERNKFKKREKVSVCVRERERAWYRVHKSDILVLAVRAVEGAVVIPIE